eukprot:2176888-Amphidinium_carterae.2
MSSHPECPPSCAAMDLAQGWMSQCVPQHHVRVRMVHDTVVHSPLTTDMASALTAVATGNKRRSAVVSA